MPTPVSYLSGNTLSYQSGMVKKGTVGLNLTSSLTGNYRWWNGVEVTASQYLIYSDTYTTGASNEANVTPAAWSTPNLTDQSLLNLINTLPDRIGQTAFTTLSNALIWLNESGEYFLIKNSYENIVTSGLTLNLDAAWTNSYTTGATFWYDLSGTGNTGTLTNGPSFTTQDGGAIVFDGANDVVRVSQQGNSLKPTYFTTEAWVKLNSNQSGRVFIATFSESQSGIGMGINDSQNNSIKFFTSGDNFAGYDHVYSTIQLNVGQWYHVTCTYDGSFKRIYINGVLNNFSTYTQTIGYINNDFTVGALDFNGSIIQSFDGNIAYARMYNRALSQSEILQNYHVTKQRFGFNNIVGNGLVLNLNAQNNISYPTIGTSWFDLTGNNNTGTLTNGPTFDSTSRSIVLDGIDDFISGSTLTNLLNGSTTLTLIIWVYPTNLNNTSGSPYKTLVDTPSRNLSLWIGANGQGQYYGIGGASADYSTNFNWENNKWQMVTIIVNATNGQIIKNNYVVSQTVSRGNNYTERVTFGNNPSFGGGNLEGRYGNILLYNRALSVAEVLQNYYQGNIVTNGLIMNLDAGNLVSYGGTGTLLKDLTNTTTGGTLTNGPTYTTSNGGSISLDGSDDYVFIAGPNSGPLNTIGTGNFTINVWASNTGSANYRWFLSNWLTTGMHMGMNASSQFGGYFGDNDELRTDYSIPSDGSWHFYTATRTSGTIKYFVDGIERTIILGNPTNKTNSLSSGTDTKIGTRGDATSQQWLGNVAIEQIYNRALSQSEIIQNFNAHKSRYGL